MPITDDDPIDAAVDDLRPYVAAIVDRLDAEEFTTAQFIEVMLSDGPTRHAYQETLRHWPESDEHLAKMIVHGQVIPTLLRESDRVEWSGFAYGEEDPYAIPAWWRVVDRPPSR